jgi:Zn-dependent peptidase ImmA (M78 family)
MNLIKIFQMYITPKKTVHFLIAHCLGHFVLHSILGKKHLETDDRKEIDGFEKEANSFASEFLMPKKVITKMYKEDKDLSKLTEYFNMPLRYIDARLSQLKVKNYRSLSHD